MLCDDMGCMICYAMRDIIRLAKTFERINDRFCEMISIHNSPFS